MKRSKNRRKSECLAQETTASPDHSDRKKKIPLNVTSSIYSFICSVVIWRYMLSGYERTVRNIYRKIFFFAIIVVLSSLSVVSGQKISQETPPLRERLFFGGTLGLQFGSYTNIQVQPMVGLWVRPRIAVALGPNFQYYKDSYYDFESTIYGGNAYIQFVPLRDLNNMIPIGLHMGIFLQLEDELLNLDNAWNPAEDGRFTVNTVLAGGGISQMLGARSSINLMFLWALNQPKFPTGMSLYSNPEIRVSFNF